LLEFPRPQPPGFSPITRDFLRVLVHGAQFTSLRP
jgi:hypothetical protein